MKCLPNRHANSKANLARLIKTLGAMIVVALIIFAVSIPAAHAQDPPQYELTWIDNIFYPSATVSLLDINEDGVVVGNAKGFEVWDNGLPGGGVRGWTRAIIFYEQATGMQNLNDLGGVWTDLITTEPLLGYPWIASTADGINENGQIVGTAINRDYEDRVFVLNFPETGPPEFTLLPRFGSGGNGGTHSAGGTAINDQGIVVATAEGHTIVFDPLATPSYAPVGIPGLGLAKEINNLGVIVASNGVVTPSVDQTGTYDYTQAFVDVDFPNDTFYGINDSGMICGMRTRIANGPPSERQDGGAFRFQYPGVPSQSDLLNPAYVEASGLCGVNEFGDVCFKVGSRGWVYLEGVGIFNLDDQVSFDTQEDESDWMSRRISTRRINDCGQIIISGGALLTPITNDPTPGITVTPTSGLTTTEDGDQAEFTVRLDTQPTADVTISVSSSDDSVGVVSPTTLNFDTNSWNVEQTVTITGQDDDPIAYEDVAYNVTLTPSSGDQGYGSLAPVVLGVTNLNNDVPPGGGSYDFPQPAVPLNIPDRSTITSTIVVSEDYGIANMNVALSIDHERPSDLRVTLIGPAPANVEVPLSNFNGDNSISAFNTASTAGTWTLEIRDTKKRKTGTLEDWSITVELDSP